MKKAVIEKGVKSSLLTELVTDHGITEEGLFADLAGYAQANASSKFFDATRTSQFWVEQTNMATDRMEATRAHMDCGLAYSAIGDHERALQQYTQAIGIDPESIGAYANRATAKRLRGDLRGALEDYSAAIRNHLEGDSDEDTKRIGGVYWYRGQTRMELGQVGEGITDMNQAIKLGHKMYHSEGKGKMSSSPDSASKYQLITDNGNGDNGTN